MNSEKTRKRELDTLVEAAEELRCNNLIVVTNTQAEETKWKGKKIRILPIVSYISDEATH